jgi:hypothetical protein
MVTRYAFKKFKSSCSDNNGIILPSSEKKTQKKVGRIWVMIIQIWKVWSYLQQCEIRIFKYFVFMFDETQYLRTG